MDEAVKAFIDRLARIETKLDFIVAIQKEDINRLSRTVDEQQVEIDDLIKFKNSMTERMAWISGGFAVVGFLAQIALRWILNQ